MSYDPVCDERPWMEHPFPLEDGSLAWIRFRKGAVTEDDARRMAEYIATLVVPTPAGRRA